MLYHTNIIGRLEIAVLSACWACMPGLSTGAGLRPAVKHDSTRTRGEDAVASTLRRMQWWAPAPAQAQWPPSQDRYVIFTVDAGGPNNIRLGLEMTAVFAQRLNRTLVLPPPSSMYLLDWGPRSAEASGLPKESTTLHEDLINLEQLRGNLATLTWDEFSAMNSYPTFEDARADAQSVGSKDDYCKVEAYEALRESRIILMDGREREGFLCSEWWLTGKPREDLQAILRKERWVPLMRDGFVWHDDAFRIASDVVNYLGMWQYVGLHARYNDFQFEDNRQGASQLLQAIGPLLTPGAKLYVASDEPGRFKNFTFDDTVHLVTFSDFVGDTGGDAAGILNSTRGKYSPERWFKLKGLVEELVCTYSKVFVGTARSSFTGHIQRMREYAGAPVTRLLWHTQTPLPIAEIQSDLANWTSRASLW